MNDFKQFLLRGNVVDLAIAVVIGVAFTTVVTAIVQGLITPLIAAIFGSSSFSDLTFTINGSEFLYGSVLNALVSFLAVAAVVFFLVVKPLNALLARGQAAPDELTTRECPQCISSIPRSARRCAFCTSEVSPAA